jgi:hypothetical protein
LSWSTGSPATSPAPMSGPKLPSTNVRKDSPSSPPPSGASPDGHERTTTLRIV